MSWADRAGWMSFDGTEIVNSARMVAYMNRVGCGAPVGASICMPCPGLVEEVSDPPFFQPDIDGAPWFDPAVPISGQFWGIGGIDVNGVASMPSEVVDGAVVRDIEFRVVLAGVNEAALSYGLGWLSVALQGQYCQVGSCAMGEMCIAVSCPTVEAPDPVRTFMDVFLVDSPTVDEVIRRSDVTFWVVEFTVRSRVRFGYQDPGPVVVVSPALGVEEMVDLLAVYANCPVADPCGDDPLCPRPLVPVVPEPPLDRCYPSEPFLGRRTVASVMALSMPRWLDVIPVVRVDAGGSDLRNLVIRFYQNALGLSCEDVVAVDPCSACTDITIPFLPAGSSTIVDGRVERALTTCVSAGGSAVNVPTLFGPAGQVFSWPSFSCSTGLCVEVIADSGVAADASVEVGLYTRWEAM